MLLLNSGYAPEEVHLLKEIGELRERLTGDASQEEKAALMKRLRENELKYNLLKEQRNRKS
jgi:hypothetical protein